MTKLSNEYDKLLQYLISQDKQKHELPVKVKPAKKETKSEEMSRLIEESKVHSFIPSDKFDDGSLSLGFNVKQFSKMMRAKLIEEHKKLQSYERPYISVSELCTCLRQCYYVRKHYPVNMNKLYQFSFLYLIQKIGNSIHSVIQELYNFSETEKTVVSERFKVKGRIDGIRESFLYEIKSIDTEKFKNTYNKEHYIQANIYAFILNTEYDYKIDTITIIYVLRNLKKIVAYDLPVDNKAAESFLSKAPILKSSLENSQLIDPFGATNETCTFCLFKDQCRQDKYSKIVPPFLKIKKINRVEKPEENKEKKSVFLL